jgi:outer membrane protein assembly factor BamB
MKKKWLVFLICCLFILGFFLPVTKTSNLFKSNLQNEPTIKKTSSGSDIDWWPMFHHDLRLSGYTTSTAPETNKVLWTIGSWENSWGDPQRSAPAIVNDKLYIGGIATSYPLISSSFFNLPYKKTPLDMNTIQDTIKSWSESFVQCVDVPSGEILWKTMLPNEYYTWGSVAVADELVYITATENYASTHGHLYCLHAQTGEILWNFTLEQWDYVSPIVSNGKVYVAGMVIYQWPSSDCILYCLDALTGVEIYNTTLGRGSPVDSPSFYDGHIFISVYDRESMETYLCCANAANGGVIWQKNLLGNFFGSSPVIYDNTVIVSSSYWYGAYDFSGILWCLDAETGQEQWHYTTDTVCSAWSTAAIAFGNVYFASSRDWDGTDRDGLGELRCLNVSTGEFLWNVTLGTWLYSSPAIANGMIYINSLDYRDGHGAVYCLNPTNGDIIWQYWLWFGSYSSPAVSDGTLFIAAPFCLYAFDDSAPLNNPPITTIAGSSKGKVGRIYNYTITAADPEESNLLVLIEWSDLMPGFDLLMCSSGESFTFSRSWDKGEYFIRARAQDINYAWSNWSVLEINITEITLKQSFLIGFIEEIKHEGEYAFVTTKLLLSVQRMPLDIRIISSGDEIIVSHDSTGFIGDHFIIGRFEADLD